MFRPIYFFILIIISCGQESTKDIFNETNLSINDIKNFVIKENDDDTIAIKFEVVSNALDTDLQKMAFTLALTTTQGDLVHLYSLRLKDENISDKKKYSFTVPVFASLEKIAIASFNFKSLLNESFNVPVYIENNNNTQKDKQTENNSDHIDTNKKLVKFNVKKDAETKILDIGMKKHSISIEITTDEKFEYYCEIRSKSQSPIERIEDSGNRTLVFNIEPRKQNLIKGSYYVECGSNKDNQILY